MNTERLTIPQMEKRLAAGGVSKADIERWIMQLEGAAAQAKLRRHSEAQEIIVRMIGRLRGLTLDEGGKADLYNVLVQASGSQLIDNQNQVVLESSYSSLMLYCDGSSKFYIG